MIGIIIPTKDNITDFFKCISSIAEHTKVDYKVYIADTGSTKDVIRKSNNELKKVFGTNYKFIKYDYYNFAKINNSMVKNHIDDDIDILVFCNNDITITTAGLIDRMGDAIIRNPNIIGTCGCRLLYPSGAIQHDGQVIRIPKNLNGMITMSHSNVGRNPAGFIRDMPKIVHGNTFALCATSRSLFEDIGMLSENYIECFEDVQYNIACQLNGRKNVILESKYIAYHHESLSRGRTEESRRKLQMDYPTICKYIARNYMEISKCT